MREIKFRAWNEIDKAMIDWSTIKVFESLLKNLMSGKVRHHQLMQYTGLKDKNGKEIYEGDIVKCNNGHIGLIEWEENDCCFNVHGYYCSSDDYPTMAFMEGQPFEVIGNIYSNPELLEP